MLIELIRHGLSVLQEQRCYQGFSDSPLSDTGKEQLVKADFEIEKVYVSPLLRAMETAEILFPEARRIVIPELKEMNFGIFEGKSIEMLEMDPSYRKWVGSMCLDRCPEGESKEEYCRRVCGAFSDITQNALAKDEQKVVIVAHGGTQMAVLEAFAGGGKAYYEWQLPPGHGYLLETASSRASKGTKTAFDGHLAVLKTRNYTRESG